MKKEELLTKLREAKYPPEILSAFEIIRREDFVPDTYKDVAYNDIAIPLGEDTTLSQPSTIAFMLKLLELKKEQTVLEIGSGSGYVLGLIHEITKGPTYGIEIREELVQKSQQYYFDNELINIFYGDGKKGLPQFAPFSRILASASSDESPEYLLSELEDDGIIVAPVLDMIVQIKKEKGKVTQKYFPGFEFVPLK